MKIQKNKLEEELRQLIQTNKNLEDKLCLKQTINQTDDSEKENNSEIDIEQHRNIEKNLLIRLKKEREERATDLER